MPECKDCEKPIDEGEVYCEDCAPSHVSETTVDKQAVPLVKAKVVANQADVISPLLSTQPSVTVFAYSIGHRGYRFTVLQPTGQIAIAWSKQMTGVEAVQLLRSIKRANRHNRLEAFNLPT